MTTETTGLNLVPLSTLRRSRLVAHLGRIGLIFLTITLVYGARRGILLNDAPLVLSLGCAWLLAFRLSSSMVPSALGCCSAHVVGGLLGLIFVSAEAAWVRSLDLTPLRALAMAMGVTATIAVWDFAVARTTAGRQRILVIGTATAADELEDLPSIGAPYEVLGVVRAYGYEGSNGVPLLGELEAISEILAAVEPDIVVVSDDSSCASVVDRLLDVPHDGFRVLGMRSFFENVVGRVPIATLSANWFMGYLHPRRGSYPRWLKRAFDVTVATVALVISIPLLIVISILLAPTGSVLYRQTRLGEGGRRFTILKFRTMCEQSEPAGAALWREGDSRVTRLGGLLRQAHLDELPQLINVLRGDMSVVGPRPERPEFVTQLEEQVPFWRRRLLVKPGVTGWAQLSSGYASDQRGMAQKLSYDLWYLRNQTLIVDLAICVRTFLIMLGAVGTAWLNRPLGASETAKHEVRESIYPTPDLPLLSSALSQSLTRNDEPHPSGEDSSRDVLPVQWKAGGAVSRERREGLTVAQTPSPGSYFGATEDGLPAYSSAAPPAYSSHPGLKRRRMLLASGAVT